MLTDAIEDLVVCHLSLLHIDTEVYNGQFKQFGMLTR